ncbi:hypothetical protein DY000_02019762 [Brassica cretica]|uniref:Coatomer subunit delta n=1 Tax=Brassica cretica TaxID=69181 RepID=A0ABQ7CV31_BRACR|nr:hypothetical protein DY000_02019762 [Brassica cretica]
MCLLFAIIPLIIIRNNKHPLNLRILELRRAAVAPPPPFTFTVKEKLNVALNQFGGISSFNLVGTLSLQTLTQDDDGFLLVQIHPRFNKSLFENKKILALMTPVPAFPTTGLVNFWPILCRNNNIRHVTISYEASSMFDDLTSAVISPPLPAAPMATRCDGHYSYDPMNSTLEWFLLLDNSNRSGSMEFVVPPFDPAVFFPSSVNFASTTTYSGLKV